MSKLIHIDSFLLQAGGIPIIDVRSPSEFNQGHIPGALNLPLLSDEDRVKVGIKYKQSGREEAILLGFDLTGHKWSGFIKAALQLAPKRKVLLHCWRGGMRSEIMAWALSLYGFDVWILEGGYKSYRRWALSQFDLEFPFLVLGGKTGSQKTEILQEMAQQGHPVIDLEGLAQHQGSSFGSMNRLKQPTQEQFENELAYLLFQYKGSKDIWVEDESRTIGKIVIPGNIWRQMQSAKVICIDKTENDRVDFLCRQYGILDPDFLIEATQRIGKRLGPLQTKMAEEAIRQNRMADFIRIVLLYYDKAYHRCIERRAPETVSFLPIRNIDIALCMAEIIDFEKNHINKEIIDG